MITTEEIIDMQSQQIIDLQNEIVSIRYSKENLYYEQIILNLREELTKMNNEIEELSKQKDDLQEQYNVLVNSFTWRKTQFLRNILWKLKGNE